MSPTPTRSSDQLASIAQAAPWVIAQRLMETAQGGYPPSAQTQREWSRMVSEKSAAAVQGWWAMAGAAWMAPWSLSAWSAWMPGATPWQHWSGMFATGDRILAEGLKPVARTVKANRNRLARRKPR